jgi:outer membrane protein assembly factor BamB
MAGAPDHPLYLGVGGHVVALDRATGTELWRRKLKSAMFVTVAFDGRDLFASASGEVFCLDPATGEVRWHNRLPRLGHGVVAFAGDDLTAAAAAAATRAAMAAT